MSPRLVQLPWRRPARRLSLERGPETPAEDLSRFTRPDSGTMGESHTPRHPTEYPLAH